MKVGLIQMLKKTIGTLVLTASLFALDNLKPTYVYNASGGVTDLVENSGKLYVSTQASSVDIFDLKTKKLLKKIKVPQIEDFMGDIVDAKVYNTDVLHGKVILTVQATSGFRELYLYNGKKLEKIISTKDKLYVSKALFVDDTHIVFCLLGNTMYYYDIKTKKTLWTLEVKAPDAEFNSTFADFALNKNKTIAAVADESGDIKIVDLKQQKVIKLLADKNLDKVFKVDYKNGKIITAGQDGRCVVYDTKRNTDYTLRENHWFLIYAAALSPDGSKGAFSSDENNNVTVFDTNTKSKLVRLTQNKMTMTNILFLNNNEIFVATDSPKFNYYKLK